MADAQSRYGIVDKLNERKISERETLSNLEEEKSNKSKEYELRTISLEQQLASKKATYKQDHVAWKRLKELELEDMKREYESNKEEILEQVKSSDASYESEFNTWVRKTEEEIQNLLTQKDSFEETIERRIKTKKTIITEIESSIDSLKEISRDSKDKGE